MRKSSVLNKIIIGLIAFGAILIVLSYMRAANNIVEIHNNQFSESRQQEEMIRYMKLKVNNRELVVDLVDNSTTKALVEKLKNANIIVDMNDYARMEKVGKIESLPRNDEYICAEAGDVILYQGNNLVIYYDNNAYSFTRVGRVKNISKEELRNLLGESSVQVELSL